MKKSGSLLFLLIISIMGVKAQQDSLLFEIQYDLTVETSGHSLSKTEVLCLVSKNLVIEKQLLRFKADTAFYSTTFKGMTASVSPNKQDPNIAIKSKLNTFGIERQTISDLEKKQVLHFRMMAYPTYYITDLPQFNWSFTSDQKSIAGYACKKALGISSNGKNWEVWYCDKFKVPGGLFGMTGLPGLIVSATQSEDQISYSLKDMKTSGSIFTTLALPDKSLLVSKEEFQRREEELKKDALAFFNKYYQN